MTHWAGTLALLALTLGAPLHAPAAAPQTASSQLAAPQPAAPQSADERFKAIYSAEWSWRQQQFPGMESEDREASAHDDHLPAVDAKTQAARLAYWTKVLHEVDAIPRAELSAENKVNFAVFRPQIENFAAGIRFREYEMPFNSDSQFWSDLGFMANRPLKTAEEARNYIARLNDVPRYFEQQTANMRAGLKRGFSVPRAVLDGRDVSISTIAEIKNVEDSDFYKPFRQLPASITADEQARLRADVAAAIRTHVIPA